MPFQRDINLQTAQGLIENKGLRECGSPISQIVKPRNKIKEGLYEEKEGKNVEYADRINY